MSRSRQRKKPGKEKSKVSPAAPVIQETLINQPIKRSTKVGFYTEYINKQLNFQQLNTERQSQLKRISELRDNRDVLVIAADFKKGSAPINAPISIDYSDLLPVNDQLYNLKETGLDIILETPGGSGEVVEDIVHALRKKYQHVAVIVPGWAKSSGTLLAMSADEILMDQASALGPIDAQLFWQGKVFSADALLEGFEKIKSEVKTTGVLNKAYIPILQGISPGEIQSAENTLKFAKVLVTRWLAKYKFKDWDKHSSTQQPVTEEEKRQRAEEISNQLCDHRRWLTHGRSIKLDDLQRMEVSVTDYSQQPDLAEAIHRYHTLLQMTFETTNMYKLFETPTSQIYRFTAPQVPAPKGPVGTPAIVNIDYECSNCHTKTRIQANVGTKKPLQAGAIPFPASNRYRCARCGRVHDLTSYRRQVEAQAKQPIVI